MNINQDTEAGQIAKLALACAQVPAVITTPSGATFIAAPIDVQLKDVTPPNTIKTVKPDVIRQSVVLQTAESLIDYVGRFKTSNTVLFADIDSDTIVAAIDYHGQTDADHVAHKAVLKLPRSLEWQLWDEIDGALQSQLDFARFIEENRGHFVRPDPANLLELVNGIHAIETVDFRAKVRTNSENVDFDIKASTEAFGAVNGEKLTLPTLFTINIPIYFGEEARDLEARLRWKKSQSEGLTLGIMLLRKEQERQAEFKAVVDRITTAVQLTSIYGRLSA
jgi:uncharacterized protein YfdQ (DUF2303 family)